MKYVSGYGSSLSIHKFKPLYAFPIALDGFEKHLRRTHPQSAIAVQRAVYGHLLKRLGVLGEPLKAIEVALEVTELSSDMTLLFIRHFT